MRLGRFFKPAAVSSGPSPAYASAKAIAFDAVNEALQRADDTVFNFGSVMTLVIRWKDDTGGTTNGVLIGQHDVNVAQMGFSLRQRLAGNLAILLSDNGTYTNHAKDYDLTSANISDGNPHTLGFTWNSGTLEGWYDGVKQSGGAVTKLRDDSFTSIYNTAIPFTVGCGWSSVGSSRSNFIKGRYAEYGLWSTKLTDTEMAYLHTQRGVVDYRVSSGSYASHASLVDFSMGGDGNDTIAVDGILDYSGNNLHLDPKNMESGDIVADAF